MKSFAHLLIPTVALWLLVPDISPAQDSAPNLRKTVTVQVVEKTKNAVVSITSSKMVQQRVRSPFGDDPFWQQFDFGTQFGIGASLGSGFIVHPDGYIVTNNHVIDAARQIIVKLVDGRSLDAIIISADAVSDLAILKVTDSAPLPSLALGDSADLMMGEPVIAVGNPLGYSHSVSEGIVSAIHRDVEAGNRVKLGDLIQTDAAINPGNSGGPLLNAYGQVIGINTAVRGDAQNIGFAIQVNKLRDLIPKLMSPTEVAKLDIPLKMKETRKVTPPATIDTTVQRAADGANIRSIAGVRPRDIVDAYAVLLKQKAGETFEVVMDGAPAVKLTPKPAAPPDAIVKARDRMGLGVEPITPMMAERMHLAIDYGMYVREVVPGSPADKVGVQPGDILFSLGLYPVPSLEKFSIIMQSLPESGDVRIGVLRGQAQGTAVLRL